MRKPKITFKRNPENLQQTWCLRDGETVATIFGHRRTRPGFMKVVRARYTVTVGEDTLWFGTYAHAQSVLSKHFQSPDRHPLV